MSDLFRACDNCDNEFVPHREAQRYCSKGCRVNAAVKRFRGKEVPGTKLQEAITYSSTVPSPQRSDYRASTALPEAAKAPSLGFGRPGDPRLQGDEYQLEYYEDGFPRLPDCLRRRQA